MNAKNQPVTKLRDNVFLQNFRTAEEKAQDEKYDEHIAGDCEWESCEWCIAAEISGEESKGG